MLNFKLLGIFIFLSFLVFSDAINFSSSSEEHGGGRGGRPPGRPRPNPPRPGPPAPEPPAPPAGNRPRCAQGWFTSYRPQGIWCLRVGIGAMDYNGAIAQCATYGGVLSGIQNEWERWLFSQEAIRQTLAYNVQFSGMWLGAQRDPGSNTFHWTDGHTTGTASMVFGPGQPDNENREGRGPQNCLQLISLSRLLE